MKQSFDNIKKVNVEQLFSPMLLDLIHKQDQLVIVEMFQNEQILIQPKDQDQFTIDELSLIEYFLYITWVSMRNIDDKFKISSHPQFIIQQNNDQVQNRLVAKQDLKQFELQPGKVQMPFLYADLIAFGLWIGCSISTYIDVKTFVKNTKEQQQLHFISIIGQNIVDLNVCCRRINYSLAQQQYINVNNSLFSASNQQLCRLRVKHIFMIANFRLQDFYNDKSSLVLPLSLALVPIFHDFDFTSSSIKKVQSYYGFLSKKYILADFQMSEGDANFAKKEQLDCLQQFNCLDCPVHFSKQLSELERCAVKIIFGEYLSQLVSSLPITISKQFSVYVSWITNAQNTIISQLLEKYANQCENSDKMTIRQQLVQTVINQCKFQDATDEQQLKDAFNQFLVIVRDKTKIFNIISIFKQVFNQLAQLSFVCQNQQIFMTVMNSKKNNFFISDGSRSGKSSVVQALYFNTIFQQLYMTEVQRTFCLTLLPPINDVSEQPLYEHYSIMMDKDINLFSCSRSIFKYYSDQEFGSLYCHLQGFVKFCLQLSVANQVDHLLMCPIWLDFSTQVLTKLQKLLSYLDTNNIDENLKQVLSYIDTNIRSTPKNSGNPVKVQSDLSIFKNKQQQFDPFDKSKNILDLFIKCETTNSIEKQNKIKYENKFLNSQQILILCFDEFLSKVPTRLQDSSVVMSFISMLKLFYQLPQQEQQSMLTQQRKKLEEEGNLVLKKIDLSADHAGEHSQVFSVLFSVFSPDLDILGGKIDDNYLNEIKKNFRKIIDTSYFDKIFFSDDLILTVISGSPSFSNATPKIGMYQLLINCVRTASNFYQGEKSKIQDFLFDIFSYRGAFLIQFRELKAVINLLARNKDTKQLKKLDLNLLLVKSVMQSKFQFLNYLLKQYNLSENKMVFPDKINDNQKDYLLHSSTLQNIFIHNSKLESSNQEGFICIYLQIKQIVANVQSCIYFPSDQNGWKLIQINTDNSVINFLSLAQLLTKANSTRSGALPGSVLKEFSSDKTSLLPKLSSVPSALTKQNTEGVDIIVDNYQEYYQVLNQIAQSTNEIFQLKLKYLLNLSLMFPDNIHLMQQLYSNLNPHIIFVVKTFKMNENFLSFSTGKQLVNTMFKTYYYNGRCFVNRFQPSLFLSTIWLQVDKEVFQSEINANEQLLFAANGFIKCKIIKQFSDDQEILFDGELDSIQSFKDFTQEKKVQNIQVKRKIQSFDLAVIRIIEASNKNLVIQQEIQSTYYNFMANCIEAPSHIVCCQGSQNSQIHDNIKKFFQSMKLDQIDVLMNHFCQNQQKFIVVKSQEEQNLPQSDILAYMKNIYDTIEAVYNMMEINDLLEFFTVQVIKALIIQSDNQSRNIVTIKVLRDILMILKLTFILINAKTQSDKLDQPLKEFNEKLDKKISKEDFVKNQQKDGKIDFIQFNQLVTMKGSNCNSVHLGLSQQSLIQKMGTLTLISSDDLKKSNFYDDDQLQEQCFYDKKEKLFFQGIRKQKQIEAVSLVQKQQDLVLLNLVQKQCDNKEKEDFLFNLSKLSSSKNVVFAQLSLDQIQQTDGNHDSQAQVLKRFRLQEMRQKATNYFLSNTGNYNKLFIFYFNTELSSVEETDLCSFKTKHGDGMFFFINFEHCEIELTYQSYIGQLKAMLLRFDTRVQIDAMKTAIVWYIGFEIGSHSICDLCNKFHFIASNSTSFDNFNCIQLGVKLIIDNSQVITVNQTDLSVFVFQPVSLSPLLKIVLMGAKRYTFFRQILELIRNSFPDAYLSPVFDQQFLLNDLQKDFPWYHVYSHLQNKEEK